MTTQETAAELFGKQVRLRARADEQRASMRERAAINMAFSSRDEKLWELGDSLLALLPLGAWCDRWRVVGLIEAQLGGR